MAIFKLSDIFGHRDLLQRLKDERDEYGMWRGSSVSESFADELSKNFGKNFGDDKVSLSDRRDFSKLEEHYDPSLNIVRANLKKTSPGILAHELGHLFLHTSERLGFARHHPSSQGNHSFFEDSEWQADRFAAELLTPAHELRKTGLSASQIVAAYGVSRKSADIRIRSLKDEGYLK